MFGDLGCGNADTATHRMDENGLVALQAAHDDDKQPSREIIDRKGGAFQRRHAGGPCEDLGCRNANRVRVATKSRHRDNIASSPNPVDAGANGIDASADFVTGHDRDRRQVRIDPHAA